MVLGDGTLGRKQQPESVEQARKDEVDKEEEKEDTPSKAGAEAGSAVFSVPGFSGFKMPETEGTEKTESASGSATFSVPGFTGFKTDAVDSAPSPSALQPCAGDSTAAVVEESGDGDEDVASKGGGANVDSAETRQCFSCLGRHAKSVEGCPDRWQCEKCRLFHAHDVSKCPTCFPDPNAARIVGNLPEEDYSEQEFSEVS